MPPRKQDTPARQVEGPPRPRRLHAPTRAAASWGARPCPGLAPAATEDVCGARNFTPAFVLLVLARVDELFRLLLLSF